ncbi:MAG: DUF2934 domain-containing protein [Verrucomicrobiae bacterium]
MSKKKSEKEPKEKKSAEKKAGLKWKKSSVCEAPVVGGVVPAAEKPKKRKAPDKKSGAAKASAITNEAIGLRAYFIAERRQKMGWPGDSTSDWVEAERQLAAEAKKK